ncbi:MAG: YlmC/YmxH family sporulation protein [Ruminococcus sp.]|nr:YlmC/YmxH family sporulation protein [Ruminococcus sp.]
MVCTLTMLRNKEVIDVKSGLRLGYVDDIEIDTETERVTSLIIFGRPRVFGLMGREGDLIVKCAEIALIGEDTILVRQESPAVNLRSRTFTVEDMMK